MNSSTEVAKAVNRVLRREGFKVKPQKDTRGKFWVVEGTEAPILEYWFSQANLIIAPSRADRTCPYLQEWAAARYLIRAIQAENPWLNDLLKKPEKPRVLEVLS